MTQEPYTPGVPLKSQEHSELMQQFESQFSKAMYGLRFDREEKSGWARGNVYEHGEANRLFAAFRSGYVLGKAIEHARQESEVRS